MTTDLFLTLFESADIDDGIIRLDSSDMRLLGIVPGEIVSVEGARRVYVRAYYSSNEDRNQRLAHVSPLTARNLGFLTGQKVRVLPDRIKPPFAELVTVQAEDDIDQLHLMARRKSICNTWNKRVVLVEDELCVPTLDRYPLSVKIVATQPQGPVQITRSTEFAIATRKISGDIIHLGGLREVYRTCSSLIQSRFVKGKATAARSVLLSGPIGCGKSRLVNRLAHENNLELHVLDVYQLVDKGLDQGSLDLGGLLSEIGRKGRTILLINHLEALKSKMALSAALAATAHSVLSQICELLDELPTQPNVLVFGVASGDFDSRLLNNHRFDVHIPVDAPNRWGREEILTLATENMSVDEGLNLTALAELSAGMTAQDIEHMAKTAELMSVGPKVTEQDFMAALRCMTPSIATDVLCDVPTTQWDEVAGLDDIKQLMKETLSWTLRQLPRFTEAGVRPPRSILLSGGQGTGKTSLVRALAAQMPMNFIEISCPILMAQKPEESTRYLKNGFALARRKAPCLLFFDDMDAFFETYAGSSSEGAPYHPIVAQLIAELDTLSSLLGVMVVAATNRPDRLAAEILSPGRFDFAVTLPLPDLTARKKVLQIHGRKLPLAADIDFDRLAANTTGMSSAEIANLCNRVGLMALRQALNTQETGRLAVVTADLFEQALRGRKN